MEEVNVISKLVDFYNNVSRFSEDFIDIGFGSIRDGEDWEDYGKYQLAEMVLQDITTEKFYRIRSTRYGDHWSRYEFNNITVEDVVEVKPKEVIAIKYIPVK